MPAIITRRSTVGGIAPSAGQLLIGELAVNVTDRKLYTLDSSNNVVLLAAGGLTPTDPYSIVVTSSSPALTLTNNGAGPALSVTAGEISTQTTIGFRVNNAARQIAWGLAASAANSFIEGREGASGYLSVGTNDLERVRVTVNGGVSFGATGTAYGTTGQTLVSAGDAPPVWADQFTSVTFVFSGAGSPILPGYAGDIQVPFTGTITEATLVADQAGSINIAISTASYSTFPGGLTSIVAAAPPTLVSQQKSTSSLTGWTTSITAGDIFRFTVSSATAVTSVTLTLRVKRA